MKSVRTSAPQNITVNGVLRSYLIWVPPSYTPSAPSPLILSYHGGGKTAAGQMDLDQLTNPFFNTDHIVVYPQGLGNDWQGPPDITSDDLGFTFALLDLLEAEMCIDTNRVFATGKSMGAGFVGKLACDAMLSARIAAFAPVSGAFYLNNAATCAPDTVPIPCYYSAGTRKGPLPILEFHGGNDTTIPYTGGGRRGSCLPSIKHWATEWAVRDGFSATPVTSQLTPAATLYQWGNGSATGVVSHIFDGANVEHDWPATVFNSDNHGLLATFNASSIIMDFFKGHLLGQTYA